MPISDCRLMDCMEGMKAFPDKFFDLAVVDPPYGLGEKTMAGGGYAAKWRKFGSRFAAAESYNYKQWDALPPDQAYFDELFRVSKNQIVWGANYFSLPPCRGPIVWDKKQPVNNFADFEFAYCSIDGVAKMYRQANHGIFRDSKTIHPTQKPYALYAWILKNYAKPGDKILDTHLGSMSSRIAAYKMGFDFWGFEIDADYFGDGDKRFRESITMPLFDVVENLEQMKLF